MCGFPFLIISIFNGKFHSYVLNVYNHCFIIIIIIIHSLKLFTSALADGFSLESQWKKISSSLQDSS